MADIAITINDDLCPGGNHFHITATAGPHDFTRLYTMADLRTAPSNKEMKDAIDVIIRIIAGKLSNSTHALARAKMNGLTISLEPLA